MTLLAANVEDAISQRHIALYCPCPEARIWPLDIPGRAVKRGGSPNLSWNSFSQWEQCVSVGGNLKKSNCFQMEFIKRMVCLLLPIVGNVT